MSFLVAAGTGPTWRQHFHSAWPRLNVFPATSDSELAVAVLGLLGLLHTLGSPNLSYELRSSKLRDRDAASS